LHSVGISEIKAIEEYEQARQGKSKSLTQILT